MSQKNIEDLVFLDECGIDDNEKPAYAYGLKGKRVYAEKNCNRKTRLSIISALNQNTLQAPFFFDGYCNRPVFEIYIERVLLPTLKPGQTIILDNASFHKGGKIEKLIRSAGCEIEYLPPYSPDFNPIEHHWFSIKNRIKKYLPLFNRDIFKAAQYAFQS